MSRLLFGIAALFIAAAFAAPAVAADRVPTAQKAALQVAMQQHIDRSVVNGKFLHLDTKTGQVESLHPVTAHPMIMLMGEHYVLCADFRDRNGKPVNIDFYMARRGQSYIVFHTAVAERETLERLMQSGRVKPAG